MAGRCNIVAVAVVFFAVIMAPAVADEALFYSCQACHESDGSGNEAVGAPAIAGMDADYVATQMRKFRDGLRGASIDDLAGRQMQLIASILTDDAEIDAVANFVAGMEKQVVPPTMTAVSGNGAELFKPCSVCHGETGVGNPALMAPAIAGLDDWYVKAQLSKFRDGIRGAQPGDQAGAQMRAAATGLSDAAIHELSVYVAILKGSAEQNE